MRPYLNLLLPFTIYPAGKDRRCYHDKSHTIRKGDTVLQVELPDSTKGYCSFCAPKMIERAIRRLHHDLDVLTAPPASKEEYKKEVKAQRTGKTQKANPNPAVLQRR
jgi:hypothetical protein